MADFTAVVQEAKLEQTENGLAPEGDGWYVLNAREAKWLHGLGSYCNFEGDVSFPDLGINLNIMAPGEPMAVYHTENAQEDFLVLAGEALLIVEDEERPLKQWDLVHCPAYTAHTILGAGGGPCVILAVGARIPDRPDDGKFVLSEAAIKRGAGVKQETKDWRVAYAPYPEGREGSYRDGSLPD